MPFRAAANRPRAKANKADGVITLRRAVAIFVTGEGESAFRVGVSCREHILSSLSVERHNRIGKRPAIQENLAMNG